MWFASLFSNEALISIFHSCCTSLTRILPAQAQAEDCQQEKPAWRARPGQRKRPASPASPSRALPKAGRSRSDGNTVRARGGCADSMHPAVPACAIKLHSSRGRRFPCTKPARTPPSSLAWAPRVTHAFTAHRRESTAKADL